MTLTCTREAVEKQFQPCPVELIPKPLSAVLCGAEETKTALISFAAARIFEYHGPLPGAGWEFKGHLLPAI